MESQNKAIEYLRQILDTPLHMTLYTEESLKEQLLTLCSALSDHTLSHETTVETGMVLLSVLQELLPSHSLKLTEMALELLSGKKEISMEGLQLPQDAWDEDSLASFVEKMALSSTPASQAPLVFDGKGTLVIVDNRMLLSPYGREKTTDSLAMDTAHHALEVFGCLSLILPSGKAVDNPSEDNLHTILHFIKTFMAEQSAAAKQEQLNRISPIVTRSLCRMMLRCTDVFDSPYTRYRILSVIRVFCHMMDWYEDERYIRFVSDYLMTIMDFAAGKKNLSPLQSISQEDSTLDLQRKRDISIILSSWNKKDGQQRINSYLTTDNEFLQRLASLVLSLNILDGNSSEFTMHQLKRDILRLLSWYENDVILEKDMGPCYGPESDSVEYKTSFFFPPRNLKNQDQWFNIFRTVCAFLNSLEGGTIYLGVNDSGHVTGLDDDLRELERLTNGRYRGMDGYIRYIDTRLKAYFNLGPMTHIRLENLSEQKIVAIRVTPCNAGIVKLSKEGWPDHKRGCPYYRRNSTTVLLKEDDCRQLIRSRMALPSGTDLKVHSLQEAMQQHKQVILHDYPSHSGCHDHTVEPYAFTQASDMVVCYDLYDNRCKVFKIVRVGSVEILEQEWRHQGQHQELKTDLFRMTGLEQYHVILILDAMAKTLLLEEYPDARYVLEETPENDTWVLDIFVTSMLGVGRFYIGLADHIEVVLGVELEEYVESYVEKYLK